MWTRDVVREILPNGLTVLLQPVSDSPAVAVVTHVRAGYFDEPDEWVGISHVLEHMYFKGTPRRAPGEMARETQQLGGYLNAGTIYDKTVYYTVLPASDGGLEHAMDIQADALMNSRIDPEELARELEVIIQEARRKLDNPPAVTVEGLYGLMFDHHRIRRWRIGTEEQLRELSARDLLSYYETRYTPDRVIVGITGDIDPAYTLDLARNTYGNWKRSPAEVAASPSEPEPARSRFRCITGEVEQPLAAIGWHTPGTRHADTPALDMTAAILSLGRGSELYRRLRIPGLAQSASAVNYTPTELGVFELFLQAAATTFDDAVTCALAAIEAVVSEPVAPEYLARVHNLLRTGWSRRFETADGRATALCAYEALGGFELLDDYYSRLLSLPPDAITETAARYLSSGTSSAVLYVPDESVTVFTPRNWPPAVAEVGGGQATGQRVREVVASARKVDHTTFECRTLEGGVTLAGDMETDVIVQCKTGTELVWIGMLSDAMRRETARTAGLSALLARTAMRGAGGLSAEELTAKAEFLGGSVVSLVYTEASGCGITVPRSNLKPALELLHAVFALPNLERDDVDRESVLQANDAARIRDDMFEYPIERVLQLGFGDGHPYGLPNLGFADEVREYTESDVRDWLDVHLDSRRTIVVVGDVGPDAVLEAVPVPARPATTRREMAVLPHAAWNPGHVVEEREKAQSALVFAFPAPEYRSSDRRALEVASAVLSGMAGRLFLELRSRMSLAYTVTSIPWQRSAGGALLTYIATSPDREEEAAGAMLSELRKLAREPVRPSELDRARNYTAGLKAIGRQTVAGVARQLIQSHLYGTLAQFGADMAAIGQVTEADIHRVAGEVLREEAACRFTVRGTAGGGVL